MSVGGGLTASISGGVVTAAALTSGTVSGGSITVSGPASITRVSGGSTAIGGVATIATMTSGAVTLSGSSATISTLSGGSVVNAGAALAVAGGTFAGTLSGSSGSLTKTGPATLVLAGSNGFSGPTTVQAGTLRLANADALSASTVGVVAGGTMSLAPDLPQATLKGLNLSAGGTVDVGAGLVTVTAGLTPETLVAWIAAGKGDGSWNGTNGIISSVAAAYAVAGARAVGWRDNGDGSLAFGYAAPGDVNLDGLIDALDSATLSAAARFNNTAVWSEGDFNCDGIYDDLDNALFVSTGLLDGGYYNTFPSAGGAIAVVPEPAGVGVSTLGLAAIAALRLRGSIRRHCRNG